MIPPSDPIDLPASWARTLGLAAASLAFVVGCGWLLAIGAFPPGSLKQFCMAVGVLFGLAGLVAIPVTYRSGPVVSVGSRGIFDRRLSTDWVPWSAMAAIGTLEIRRTRMMQVRLDPLTEAAQPMTVRARRGERANARFGYAGYSMTAATLRGGFPALIAAVHAHAPPRLSGSMPPT